MEIESNVMVAHERHHLHLYTAMYPFSYAAGGADATGSLLASISGRLLGVDGSAL